VSFESFGTFDTVVRKVRADLIPDIGCCTMTACSFSQDDMR
jgi:hypothetical protein